MKKGITLLVVAGLLLVGLRADARTEPSEASLEKYRWKRRPLLLFAPSENHPPYLRQKETVQAHAQGIEEREMVVIALVGEDKVYINGELQRRRQGRSLRKRFQVPTESFAVLLVGKDGTEKSRSGEPVRMEEVFSLIDQMPVRRQEMRSENE